MGCDRNDGDNGSSFLALGFIGAAVPKNAVSAGGAVLSARLEHFLAIGTSQGGELVRIKAWMVWVDFQVTDSLPNLHEDRSFRMFERLVLLIPQIPARFGVGPDCGRQLANSNAS